MSRCIKIFCFTLMSMVCMQAAFARDQVDFVFNHNLASGAWPDREIYLHVKAWWEGIFIPHAAETPKHGLPLGGHSVDNVRSAAFAPNPAGEYDIEVRCSFTPDIERSSPAAHFVRRIPRNGMVTIDVACPVDKAGELLPPIAQINIHRS